MLEQVEDPADVRMGDPSRQLDFAAKTLIHALIRCDVRPDRLQRNAFTQRKILGLVELPHSAARDEAHDTKPLAEQIALPERRKSRKLGRTGVVSVGFRSQGIVERRLHLSSGIVCYLHCSLPQRPNLADGTPFCGLMCPRDGP